MPNLAMPHSLSRESLVQIVTSVRDLLYYDVDDADREFWNPEKIRDTDHIFQRIGETLEEYNLVPTEEAPCDLESDNLPRLIRLPCFGMVVRLERPSSVTVARAGTITSDLIDAREPECSEPSRAAFYAIESLVLAHACVGLDIASPVYIEGIETAVEAIINNA